MKKYAIIVAGGKGLRMGNDIPKQFLLLNDKPTLMHTIEAFYRYSNEMEIIVVLPESQFDYWGELRAKYRFDIAHRVVPGGDTRFHSVKSGLQLVDKEALVAVHDGVRALVTSDIIGRVFDALGDSKGAYPIIPVSDTLREWIPSAKIYKQVDRGQYRLTQTPQAFFADILINAYDRTKYSHDLTDDVSVVEHSCPSASITTVEGSPDNIKITKPEDLIIASAILKCRT